VNKDAGYVTLLSIPRDLYVYLPGVKMGRINTADLVGKPFFPGGGPAYLEETILYNLGIPVDYYARINFDAFKAIVDTLGGIDVPVSCAIQDWRLKSPELDPQNADNWYLSTQDTGLIHMDGDLALWYARSRKNNTDFDRSRRQMQVLRAIFQRAKDLNFTDLTKIPALYEQFKDVVQTDIDIGAILRLAPMAVDLDTSRIHSYSINAAHVSSWTTPDNPPQNVLIPNPDAIAALLDKAFAAPEDQPEPIQVEVWNGTPNGDWLALALDNLRARGFAGVAGQADRQDYPAQVLYDFTNGDDTTARVNLQKLFGVKNENVIAQPDASAPHPYRIVLGADWNSCIYPVPPPKPTPTPGA
ncbi:MAG: LCP family protein, partial [Chloroflexi bacterium]|nr:LCP family protein [Chloroflexota bacterium]